MVDLKALREAIPIAERTVGPLNDSIVLVFDTARAVLDAPVVWRCWENMILGGPPTDADWTPHLERPSYCRPENGHKDCGRVALVRIGDE